MATGLKWRKSFDYDTVASRLMAQVVNMGISATWARTGPSGLGGLAGGPLGASLYARDPLPESLGHVILAAAYKADLWVNGTIILALLDNGSLQVELRAQTDGRLYCTRNGTLIAGSLTTAPLLFPGLQVQFQWRVKIDNAAGELELRVNGNTSPVITLGTLDTQATANPTASQVQLGDHANLTPTRSFGFDDCWLVDMAVVGAGFLGDKAIHYLGPTGAGFYGDFSVVGAATAHEALDDVPPDDDTTRIASSTVGHKTSVALADSPVSGGAIDAVWPVLRQKKSEAGARSDRPFLRAAATDAPGTTKVLGTAYAYDDQAPFETKPAGGAWDDTALTGLEVGVEVVS